MKPYLQMQGLNCLSLNYPRCYGPKLSRFVGLVLLLSLSFACSPELQEQDEQSEQLEEAVPVANSNRSIEPAPVVDSLDYDTTQWTELITLDSTIRLDIRYATENNFVGQVLYGCARCFLRPAAAQAVLAAHQELKTEGLGLKMFDCYRPRDVQYRLWEIFPKPGYVANPDKGSIHNRGGAVDLTIVDSTGQELPMGTDFDFFGPKANHTYTDLPKEVLANRRKLRELMGKYGFSYIRSEWWHYNFRDKDYELADEEWNCELD
ncbi:MAG: M15 family metallopeptidase [Bacteroidota bacterium]